MMEGFNASFPWREPESATFHRERYGAPVGAYTPTQEHEHAKQKNKHSQSQIQASC